MSEKIMGLDGKMYDMPQEQKNILDEKMDSIQTGMIMDNVQTLDETNSTNPEKINSIGNLDEQTLQRLLAYQNRKPSVREHKKISRNDECPCGSGKKYKKCCLESGKFESLIKK